MKTRARFKLYEVQSIHKDGETEGYAVDIAIDPKGVDKVMTGHVYIGTVVGLSGVIRAAERQHWTCFGVFRRKNGTPKKVTEKANATV